MDIFSKKRKGMELPINTIVILIVLLVALAIMLILITRSGADLVDIGGVKIEGAGGASECQQLCWSCCRAEDPVNECQIPPSDLCSCVC